MRLAKYLAEGTGTFFLVFMGTGAVIVNAGSGGSLGHLGVSLVFGLVVLAMVYALGHLSGAHLNPAVSLGFAAAGRLSAREIGPYIAAQLVGAVAASAALKTMFPADATLLGATLPSHGVAQAFGMELVLTLMLMFVILAVATDERAEGTMAGVAIGATVALEALVGGPVSGASMNPARSLGPALMSGHMAGQWIYWAAPILGSLAAVVAYQLMRCPSAPNPDKHGCC